MGDAGRQTISDLVRILGGQVAVAEALGVSQATVSRWLSGLQEIADGGPAARLARIILAQRGTTMQTRPATIRVTYISDGEHAYLPAATPIYVEPREVRDGPRDDDGTIGDARQLYRAGTLGSPEAVVHGTSVDPETTGVYVPADADGSEAPDNYTVLLVTIDDPTETEVCIYCDTEVPASGVPAVDDDDAWAEVRRHHAEGCEWVATRAHQRDEREQEAGEDPTS